MRINQTIEMQSVHNTTRSGNSDEVDMQLSGGAPGIQGQEMDIHKMINDCSTAAPAATFDQKPLNCNHNYATADGPSMTMTTTTDINTADYLSDAFGELCLDTLNCDNNSNSSAVVLEEAATSLSQNMTRLLLDGGEENYMGFCMNRAGNISYLNVSCEFELEYATPLYGFCIPFLLFVTVTANLLIVIVLSRRSMATPTNAVLMGKWTRGQGNGGSRDFPTSLLWVVL